MGSVFGRVLEKVVVLREGEGTTAWLMFAYSFLAMTSYNILKPITRSKFITSYGADNLPWILLVAGLLIAVLMHQYARVMSKLPRQSVLPVTQAGIILLLLAFWALLTTRWEAVSIGLYLFGQILGLLLISQFWTLANDIYDARQAKRIFGFVGGGASLGGAFAGGITKALLPAIGSANLLLVSAAALAVCAGIVLTILKRHRRANLSGIEEERGVGGAEALRLLAQSSHLRVIALVIGLAAIGATIVEQQLNMAAEARGGDEDAITAFLNDVQIYISLAGFVVQVGLTSYIHRSFGLAVALLLLPFTLGSTATLILVTGAVWAPQVARVLDSTLRYTVDKTTREILFLPLPVDVKYRAKPFIDVTVDRAAKALAAVLLLVLVQPWGFDLDWTQLSYASFVVMGIWVAGTLVARREYLSSFRRSIGAMAIAPDAIRADLTDAASIEALVEELSHPDEASVLYAITVLESIGKLNLVTPLLLQHASPRVRARALAALAATRSRIARAWTPTVERMVQDPDVDVRAAALRALAALAHEDAAGLMRRHLADIEPRVAVAAATALANTGQPADVHAADQTLRRLIADVRATAAGGRVECARALAHIAHPQFRSLLVPLLNDHDAQVVGEAVRSARALGAADGLFLPGLLSLLGHRSLKAEARAALVGCGESVVGALGHALLDRREHIWLRRHIPATLALIPTQASMDALVSSLAEPDGFLRYKAIAAIERLTRANARIEVPRATVETQLVQETSRYCNALTLHYNLIQHAGAQESLVERALTDKMARALDRVYRLLGLLYHVDDIAAARQTIERGEARHRAQALEYLDNLLSGAARRHVLPILDDMPLADRVRHANAVLRSRARDLDDTLAQLVHDDDPVVAAAAIHFVARAGRWSLSDDLEYVASRQSGGENAVGEAARWALQSKDGATGARETDEPLPVVEITDRIRAIPIFAGVSIDELFRIAAAGQEVRVPAGRELHRPASAGPAAHFLIAGSLDVAGHDTPRAAPAVLGLEEVLEGKPAATAARAREQVTCLRVDAPEFLTMLADNARLAQGLFGMILATGDGLLDLERAHGGAVHQEPGQPARAVDLASLLRQHPLFARASGEQLLALTSAFVEVVLTPGTTLLGDNTPPAIHVLLQGEVAVEPGGAEAVTVGTTIGVAETLAGRVSGRRARVVTGGRALRLDRERFFDVLSDRVDLMQALFADVLARRGAHGVGLP